MKVKSVVLFVVFSLSFILSPKAFSDYASLVGKRIELHGPWYFEGLGVAVDERTCDKMIAALYAGDDQDFKDLLLYSYKVMRVSYNAKALVLDTKVFEGKAKVIIITGVYRGMTGWVPIEWLKGNEKLPRLSALE